MDKQRTEHPSKDLRVHVAQMNVRPGMVEGNARWMLDVMQNRKDCDLLLFPELALPGYLLGDHWEREAFLRECEHWAKEIEAASRLMATGGHAPVVVFGTVIVDWESSGEDGRPRKFNGFVAAQGGKALTNPGLWKPYGVKTLLPDYREFEDTRHFYDLRRLALESGRSLDSLLKPYVLHIGGRRLQAGIVLCEDAWDLDYHHKPLDILAANGAQILINLSCSPFTQGKNDKRNRVFGRKAATLGLPLIYANTIGLQNNGKTVFTFDGSSTLYDAQGGVAFEAPAFSEDVFPIDVRPASSEGSRKPRNSLFHDNGPARPRFAEESYPALEYGIRAFLEQTGIRKVVVGSSGGIDSAVSAALYARVVAPENLILLNLPSRFNSETTKSLSRELAENLGCYYGEVPIEESITHTSRQLADLTLLGPDLPDLRLSPQSLHLENIQARDRSSRVLAAVAAVAGGGFTCNANKTELTVGYSTLYGDLGGFLAALGDLWKGQVYALGKYLNASVFPRPVIPKGCFTIPPSAELSAEQAVEQGKGDPLVYPYHDRLFHSWVQRWRRATPEENLEWYLDGSLNQMLELESVDAYTLFPNAVDFIEDLERWWNLYSGMAVAKRIQAPPVLALSSRAFGFDHRESQGAPLYSLRYKTLKRQALS